jgi:hypothetical protein
MLIISEGGRFEGAHLIGGLQGQEFDRGIARVGIVVNRPPLVVFEAQAEGDGTGDLALDRRRRCVQALDLFPEHMEAAGCILVQREPGRLQAAAPLGDGQIVFVESGQFIMETFALQVDINPLRPPDQPGHPRGKLGDHTLLGMDRQLDPHRDLGRCLENQIGRRMVIGQRHAADEDRKTIGGKHRHRFSLNRIGAAAFHRPQIVKILKMKRLTRRGRLGKAGPPFVRGPSLFRN